MLNFTPQLQNLTARLTISHGSFAQVVAKSARRLRVGIVLRLMPHGRQRIGRTHGTAKLSSSTRSRPSLNTCEFDYDYYVALQERRQAQPIRLNRQRLLRELSFCPRDASGRSHLND
jgi:hypothetical protein